MRKLLYLLLIFILPGIVFSDYLVVSRPASIKKLPERLSSTLLQANSSDTLVLVSDDQKNGYYNVKISHSSKKGWIYRTFVHRFKGNVPVIKSTDTSDNNSPCYSGVAKSTNSKTAFTVLKNIGYWVGYSESYKTPLWSAYHLLKVDNPQTFPRPRKFSVDNRTVSKIRHEDYNNSGYDRGHMAPNAAICSRYGEDAQKETFFMSNICPQCPGLNEETWEAFEKVESTKYANDFGEIWVVDGPIFSSSSAKLPCGVSIPDKFYKIIVDEDEDGSVYMLGIIMDQCIKGQHQIKEFVATVDSIEALTGLDFFSDLPDDIEKKLESSLPDESWDIEQDLVPTFHARKQIDACTNCKQ